MFYYTSFVAFGMEHETIFGIYYYATWDKSVGYA